MKFGGAMFFTDYAMEATDFAIALEQRGFESIWAPEHSHIPLSRNSAFPPGGELPRKYAECMDPFVSLTAAAVVTKKLMLGTGVALVVQRDPIQTAKLVASIDQVSKGRFLFGIGGGWNAEEMADHGTTDFKGRWKLVRERMEAMKAIWTQEEAEYHGSLVDFGPMLAWPKPFRKPYPPVIVGGAFPYGARRAIAYGDGWIPHRSRPQYGDVGDFLPEFRKMAQEAGRDPASLPVTIWGAPNDMKTLEGYREIGVSRVIVSLDSSSADAILPQLDAWAETIRKFT
ncbi:MAG: LLM class F420-dependent oxidoreductase [Acetobacteraceae bacterium]